MTIRIKGNGLIVAALAMRISFPAGAAAQDDKLGEDLLKDFFADHRTEMQKSSDSPQQMEAYVLAQKNVRVRDKDGETLLHYAANKGYLPIVELLVKKGADVNALDNAKRTPLHEAMSYHAYEVAKFLITNGANMTLKDKDDHSPLFSIVFIDGEATATGILNFFIQHGFDITKSADANLLRESIARNHREVALILLKKGIKFDDSSLFAAAGAGFEDIFAILLSRGASPRQEGILHAACESGSLVITQTLVERGEKPTSQDIDSALYEGHVQVAAYLNGIMEKTHGQVVEIRKRCELKPAGGNCKALFSRAYYDAAANTCREFTHGGCGGVVPFSSVEACSNVCVRESKNAGASR
jgi:ankyrin repeat protein